MRTFSKFLVLLWKNLLLKRRHWFMTILEIAVPVLLFVILAVIRGEIDPPLYKEVVNKTLETYQVTLDHQKQLKLTDSMSPIIPEIFLLLLNKTYPRPTIWCRKCSWIVDCEKMGQNKALLTSGSAGFLPQMRTPISISLGWILPSFMWLPLRK